MPLLSDIHLPLVSLHLGLSLCKDTCARRPSFFVQGHHIICTLQMAMTRSFVLLLEARLAKVSRRGYDQQSTVRHLLDNRPLPDRTFGSILLDYLGRENR